MKKRILVLVHESLVPPKLSGLSAEEKKDKLWETEYDVISTLIKMKYEVRVLGAQYELTPIRSVIDDFKPHLVFNLLEEFHSEAIFDQNIVSYLELLKVAYTGCNPRGMILARDKALAKKVLNYHRIKTAQFKVYRRKDKLKAPKRLKYPVIVKCLNEEASMGLAKASVVNSHEKLFERVKYIHENCDDDAIAEEFIEGREMYVGIFGNKRLKALPVWELVFAKTDNPEKEFYSSRAKFNPKYRKEKGIDTNKAKITTELEQHIQNVCKKVYKVLNLSGYARIDLRLTHQNEIYILEANPNPDIAIEDEFALSAKYAKISYKDLIKKIISLAN